MKTALYWNKDAGGRIRCELCPHKCVIPEGRTGICKVREVSGGELKAAGYGLVSSAHVDPIEKKPLHHFNPGASIFSVGGWGCNLGCVFCQNWTISQRFENRSQVCSPEEIVRIGGKGGSIGIAYTYNEPLIGFEFVRDTALFAREKGLCNVLVTNGYIMPAPAAELLPLIDALNIDIKGMDDGFYRKQCRASLKPVLDFAAQSVGAGCHVEITNLVIPGLNDSDRSFKDLAEWMAKNLGETVPLHLSAYHPDHNLDVPATPEGVLVRAFKICREHLSYVYVGNVMTDIGRDTTCPACNSVLIERMGYSTRVTGIEGGACAKCKRHVDVVMKSCQGRKESV